MENNLIETSEQQHAMTKAALGKTFYIAGAAGTGKSVFIEKLREKLPYNIVVAPTGVAALNCGGYTIHKMFGIGTSLGWTPPPILSSLICERLKPIQSIIIDEVSMVRADLMDSINKVMQLVKNNTAPFGGTQVVMLGDMAQLPPVVTNTDGPWIAARYKSPYWFDAKVWKGHPPDIVRFTTVFRQKEQHFADILKRLRQGDYLVIPEINKRKGLRRKGVINLCARTATADSINLDEMSAINSPKRTYMGELDTSGKVDTLPAPRYLELKVGAQVMTTKNMGAYVNGSIGSVVELDDDCVTVCLNSGEVVNVGRVTWDLPCYEVTFDGKIIGMDTAEYTQFPLIPAFAITVHKSQGLTLDAVHIDLGTGAFASGQAYVALSRCRSLETLTLARELQARDVFTDKILKDWIS